MYSDASHGRRRRTTAPHFSTLVLPMGIGSIIGAFLGAALVVYVSSNSIKLILGCLLIFSAVKLFLEKK